MRACGRPPCACGAAGDGRAGRAPQGDRAATDRGVAPPACRCRGPAQAWFRAHRAADRRPPRPARQAVRARAASPPRTSTRDLARADRADLRTEEHTSELQSLMRISYAVFCLKKKTKKATTTT